MNLIKITKENIFEDKKEYTDLVASDCSILNVKLVCNDGKVVDFEIE